ncbi:xanthine dehydrogenase accessory protein XdhC [Chromohalobacter nigrandesensis]|uniref:xanthine dehydrogenase accessory protein XdhC n=1 Tax=Chromohalobacter nigrandesensis TaxID=119863 RepID=UPI001FF4B39E|nr:xanthine dehydrogenase accessory protein XdhC [Chromohalobacter nigrandesensis]MCK0743609.1 xanthine dehydrogenase accessory protein XdhC [Chromohalobacter nigrandesensis]
MNPETWHSALHRLQVEAAPHVLISVVGAEGSTPREPGAKMVVTAETSHDTLGGGRFEYQAIACARDMLAASARGEQTTTPRLEAFPLGGRSGQCCGGHVSLLFECFAGAEQHIAIFGAGHVAQALVPLLTPLGWRIHWFDSRADAFAALAPSPRVDCQHLDESAIASAIERALENLPHAVHALVMTHDHTQDRRLIDALLGHDGVASIGLIGSQSKWASFQRPLGEAGHDATALARVRCPIGIPGAGGKRPYEIALAIAAELLTFAPAETQASQRGVTPTTWRQTTGQGVHL